MGDLEDASVVITGASRGLGRALALALARRGARTVLVARDEAGINETVRRLGGEGKEPVALVGSIANLDDVRRIRDTVLAIAAPTALINNASQFAAGSLAQMSPEVVAAVLETGVVGSTLMAQAFLPALRAAGTGLLLNIGARVASPAYPLDVSGTSLPYQTGKRYLTLLSAALRQEAPDVAVATLYLPPIGSAVDLDDPPEALARAYPGQTVLPLAVVAETVGNRLAGVGMRWEEWVLSS